MTRRDPEVEALLVRHCAPVLAGVKPANLISLPRPLFVRLWRYAGLLRARGVSVLPLCRCRERGLVLLYRGALLNERLRQAPARACLRAFGYPVEAGLLACLSHLKRRTAERGAFPHEVGVFLGYPMEDVRGFIENGGRRFKACGAWKVYGDVEAAQALFQRFRACREESWRRLCAGEQFASLIAA